MELINREDMKEEISEIIRVGLEDGWLSRERNRRYLDALDDCMEMYINHPQSIDPVHAAGGCYCRECEYFRRDDDFMTYCDHPEVGCLEYPGENDFCGRGKIKSEQN